MQIFTSLALQVACDLWYTIDNVISGGFYGN